MITSSKKQIGCYELDSNQGNILSFSILNLENIMFDLK